MNSEKSPNADSNLLVISQACRILGALFYYDPRNPDVQEILQALQAGDFSHQWPLETTKKTVDAILLMRNALLRSDSLTEISQEFQRLFIGPDSLAAPPWGSVYLEEEGTLFGETTQALHIFLKSHGITLNTGQEEPEDHIGLVFFALALLAEDRKKEVVHQLFQQHLISWINPFLKKLYISTSNDFYRGLSLFTEESVDAIQEFFE